MLLLDKIHGVYVHTRRVRILTREMGSLLPERGRVLDVGSGDGLLGSLIQREKPGLEITGIDVLVRSGTHIPVREFNGMTIPFPDGSFDSVMFADVLHHTDDPVVLLREAARVSRASIVIKDHTMDGLAAAATLRFMDRVSNERHNVVLPYNYWPEKKWRTTFAELGLDVAAWLPKLRLYPLPADWVFGRSLQFITKLRLK